LLAILDSGPLYAATNAGDSFHRLCAELLRRSDVEFVVPALCVGEVAYLAARDLGPIAEATFVAGCRHLDIRHPAPDDFARMAALMTQYADFPLGAVDASVIVLAERLGADSIATLDHRHFRAIRPRHVESFTLLP
jgi:hypothetical protein